MIDNQDDGVISKVYDKYKEATNSELAKNNVQDVVDKQSQTAEFLQEAKDGKLTYKDYLERKRNTLLSSFPNIDKYNDEQKQKIKQGIDTLDVDTTNRLQQQILALPNKDDAEYKTKAKEFFTEFLNVSTIKTEQKTINGEISTSSTTTRLKKAYNPSDGDRLMTFEEVFKAEQGVEFNKDNIQKYNESVAKFALTTKLNSAKETINKNISLALERYKVDSSTGLNSTDITNSNLALTVGSTIMQLYGRDNIAKGLADLTDGKYTLDENTNSLEDLANKYHGSITDIAKLIQTKINERCDKAMGGKSLDDYAKTMAEDYKNAYGFRDANALANAFAQDQEGIVQTARNGVQIVGTVVMVGGMAFCPPAALGGGLIASFGGIGVEALNESTKQNASTEKMNELKKEFAQNVALFAVGAGAGKLGSSAKAMLTAKNAPKFVAMIGDIGVDSTVSLIGDLVLTGQLDITGEGFSQVMSLIAGHKGKIVKGVQHLKEKVGDKFRLQSENPNKNIMQMPNGTLVEVKPDGSTVEVKADKVHKNHNSEQPIELQKVNINGENVEVATQKPLFADKTSTDNQIFKSEEEFKEFLKKQTLKVQGQVTRKFSDDEINELLKLQQKQPDFSIKNLIDLYPYSKGNEIQELIPLRKSNSEIFDLLTSETRKTRFSDTSQRFGLKEIKDIMSNLNKDNTSFAKELILKTKSYMGVEIKAYDGAYISAFLQIQNKFGDIDSLKDYMNIVKDRNISSSSFSDNQILDLVLNEDKTTLDQIVKMYKHKSFKNGKFIYTNSSTEIKNTINFLKQNNDNFKEHLSNISDKRITDEVENLLTVGKFKDAEDLVDVINNFNQKYHTIYDSNNPSFKRNFSSENVERTLRFSKYLKSQGMSLEDLANGNITKQLRKQLISKKLSVETLVKDFQNDTKYKMMENFINKNPDSDISNYLYENYYLKDIASQKIDSSLLEKRNKLINACKKINQRFNVKIIMSSDISNGYKTMSYVYKELTNWIKASEGKAKLPPIIDFSTAKSNWYDTTSAYGKSASGGYSHSAYNGTLAFPNFKLKTVSYAMRHELTHTNDLKRGTKISKDYNLNEIMPKTEEELPNGNIIKSGDAKKGKYYQEFVNAGIPDKHISYAYNNTLEFIAVASEGDMSKYSPEFKQVLIDFGMPEWMFNLEK